MTLKLHILLLVAIVGVTIAQHGGGGGGFFSNLANNIRNRFVRRPQEQFSRPPQQSFRQNNNFPNSQRFNPVQQQQRPAVRQNFRQPQQQFRQQQQQPQQQQVNNVPPQNFRPQQNFRNTVKPGKFGCPGNNGNLNWQGRDYIVTWLIGCKNFTAQEADEYCVSQGGRAVSLDTNEKFFFFRNVTIQYAQRYFWTGGRIDHNAGVVTWPSGAREGYERGKRFWSPTGGAKPPQPQPDNREGDEVCIGVLNNFYADGIVWHDVSCHHRKPTICEL